MKQALFILVFALSTLISLGQPGSSTLRVSFNLPSKYSKTERPTQINASLTSYFNGKSQVNGYTSTVYFNTDVSTYSREVATFSINGHPTGVDIFDSVSITVTLDGFTYSANSKVGNTNSLFVADFSGEYNYPVICDTDYSGPTRYPSSRPGKEELKATVDQIRKNTVKFSGPYIVVRTSDQQMISDALVICNGDTLPQSSSGLYIPKGWIKTKTRIEVYHPNYPSLVLDSCILPIETVYLLKEHEPYYVDMGLKHPLKNNNHQKVALRFKVETEQEIMDSCLHVICANQHYKIAYHYPDSLKVHNEMIYGGVADLSRIVLLERRTPITIGNTYINQFDYFKQKYPIDGIFRPVSHETYLNNRITVVYKEGVAEVMIQEIEREYNLKGFRIEYQQFHNSLRIDYELDVFITPNYLVEQLMRNQYIQNVIIGKVNYTHY